LIPEGRYLDIWRNPTQRIILIAFFGLNCLLIFLSVDNGPYLAAADVSVNVEAAQGLIEGRGFAHPDGRVFVWGMPLYPAFLAVFLALLPWKVAIYAVVVAQCVLLYLIGLATRDVTSLFAPKAATVAQVLLLFNPNMLATAHLLQTEILFTYFFLAGMAAILRYGDHPKLGVAAKAGILLGLATMVRPAGQFVVLLLPILIVVVGLRNEAVRLKMSIAAGMLAATLAVVTIAPWATRNYIHFGTPFLTVNSGLYLAAQYRQLLHTGHGMAEYDTLKEGAIREQEHLSSINRSPEELRDLSLIEQSRILTSAYVKAIADQPISAHARAFTESWVQLYVGGGASNLKNYLGLDSRQSIVQFEREGRTSVFGALTAFASRVNFSYAALLIVAFTYTVLCRIAGIGGLIRMLRNEAARTCAVLGVMAILSLSYLYVGQSRFRVPLEPFLATMAAIGLVALRELRWNGKRRGPG
jgi:4-amino-4-deoxy-L-arabinose transferase-like glycosyltransferase